MQIDYRRDLNRNYLILHGEQEADTASYQIRMMLTNRIPGLLSCRIGKLDADTLFYYDITSRQSVESVFEHRPIGYEFLTVFFDQLLQLLDELSGYLLPADGLQLSLQLIFTDAEQKSFAFCYVPAGQSERSDFAQSMREMMEYMLPKLDHQDSRAVVLGYGLYREITAGIFSLDDIRNLLVQNAGEQEIKSDPPESELLFYNETAAEQKEQEKTACQVQEQFFDQKEKKKGFSWEHLQMWINLCLNVSWIPLLLLLHAPAYWYMVPLGAAILQAAGMFLCPFFEREKKENREEPSGIRYPEGYYDSGILAEAEGVSREEAAQRETVRNFCGSGELKEDSERTVLLSGENRGTHLASLIPVETTELPVVVLTREHTLIGKMASAADVVLPCNTISRLHAKITKSEGEYYLSDMNSRNGTSVNGVVLSGTENKKLQDGDEIAFADQKYYFVMQK